MNSEAITEKQAVQLRTDAREADRANQAGRMMSRQVVRALEGQGLATLAADLERADDSFMRGQDHLHRLMKNLPATPIEGGTGSEAFPTLAALATFGGPDARELLELLERAQAVAERIDAARGLTVGAAVDLLPGESAGTDLSESIALIALRVRGEASTGARSPHE